MENTNQENKRKDIKDPNANKGDHLSLIWKLVNNMCPEEIIRQFRGNHRQDRSNMILNLGRLQANMREDNIEKIGNERRDII